jgi:hypothetical protein
MPNYQIITRERHGAKRWLRYTGYAFAMRDAVMPLALAELAKAALSLPIGFIAQGDGFIPAAVMSLQAEKNLFIAADGRWIHGYIPAAIRGYPFRLAKATDGRQVLCIDEDSGLVHDGPDGESFFDDEGKPVHALRDIMNFLEQTEQSRQVAAHACAILNKHQLIKPWPITCQTERGDRKIDGLFRIDETALNQIAADALFEVRNAGGLQIAYCQLISMQHLPALGELTVAHAKAAAQSAMVSGELNLELFKKNDSISFNGFSVQKLAM